VWDLLSPEFEEAVLVGVGFDESCVSLSITILSQSSVLHGVDVRHTHLSPPHAVGCLLQQQPAVVVSIALQGQRATEQFK
jgi:hypothetical protein